MISKMKQNRKNNKGFSLVELIIVIAIMVALVAVLAPQFVKYVNSSRDAALQQAAEDVLSVAKSEYALGNVSGTGSIVVRADANKHISVTTTGLTFSTENSYNFVDVCGLDTSKEINSTKVYTITVGAGPTFTMATSDQEPSPTPSESDVTIS